MPKPMFPQWLNICSSVVQDEFREYVFCVLSHFSCIQRFATLWTVARQAPLSMGLSRQEYWSRLPFPSPGDLPIQESNPRLLRLLHWPAGSLPLAPPGRPLQSITAFSNEKDWRFICDA